VFSEKQSGLDKERPELARCLQYVREGDVLVVTKLDRPDLRGTFTTS
jgi:DNA invertase Pin-like site-specific DNA recombinase